MKFITYSVNIIRCEYNFMVEIKIAVSINKRTNVFIPNQTFHSLAQRIDPLSLNTLPVFRFVLFNA